MPQILPGVITKQSAADFQGWNASPPVPDPLNCRMYYNSDTNTVHVIDPNGADILATAGGGVTGTIDDTNVTGTIVSNVMVFGWNGTLASGRLNSNVVQNVHNDTNLQGLISAQTMTLSWNGVLGTDRGGLGIDISATGGPTQILAQDINHNVVVRDLVASDIPAIAESQVSGLAADLATKQSIAEKGQPSGYAGLDSSGLVPLAQLPSFTAGTTYVGVWNATTNTPTLVSSVGVNGQFYEVAVAGSTSLNGISSWNVGDFAIFNGSVWQQILSYQAVTSVAGRTGAIVIAEGDVTNLVADLALKAPLASPTFTGSPVAPTTATGDSSTKLATTALVTAKIAANAPGLAPVQSVAGRTGAVVLAESDITNLVTDLAAKQATSAKGVANGYASLDSGGTVPLAQIPASLAGATQFKGSWNAATNTPTLTSSVGTQGWQYVVSVAGSTSLNGITNWQIGDQVIFNGSVWTQIPNVNSVTSVAGRTGAIVIGESDVTNLVADLALKANLASPTFSGAPLAPTASPLTNSTQLATTAYADSAVLAETNNRISADALKANLASPALTGTPTAPTALAGTNTTQLATCAFVTTAVTAPTVTSVAGRTGAIVLGEADITGLVADLAAKQATSSKGVANGYASLDSGGFVPLAQIPPSVAGATQFKGSWDANANSPTLTSSVGTQGFLYVVSVAGTTTLNGISSWSVGDQAIFNGSVWTKIPNVNAVTSVAGRTGAIVIGESDVTNLTSDLALKAALASPALTGTPTAPTQAPANNSTRLATTAYADGAVLVETNNRVAADALKANLASPALTGNPTAPTQPAGTNSTRIASTAYTDAAVLVETTARINADALKANLASPALTGVPTAPTAAQDINTTQVATTAFVLAQASITLPIIDGTATAGTSKRYSRQDHIHPTDISRAALISPVFTGVPQAPTAAFGTNTTQIATTGFVQSAIFGGTGAVLLSPTGTQTIAGGFPLINAGSYIGVTNPSASPADASLRIQVNNAGRSSIVNSGAFQSTIFFDYDGGIVVNPAAASASGLTINNSPVLITYGGTGAALTLGSSGNSNGGLALAETGTSIQRGPSGAGLFHVQWPNVSGTVALLGAITAAPLTVSGSGTVAYNAVIFQTVEATGGVGGITLTLQGTSMAVGYCYTIKKVDSGVGAVTIIDSTSKLFDGDSSYILSDQWQFVTVQWTGSRFDIVGAN